MDTRAAVREILIMMLWAGDKLTRPTLANLTESYEAWERRYGFHRQLARMEEAKLLRREVRGNQMVYQLTALGRLEALGGKDVMARWDRDWDGHWRQVLFDLPVNQQRVRMKLWRWLRQNGFGYLQQSLWIHPDPVTDVVDALNEFREDVESFILMEATCCTGYSNEAVILGAWDFTEINRRHEAHIARVTLSSRALSELAKSPDHLGRWLREERFAWRHALALDPLLPRPLWPKGYRGEHAWQSRLACYRALSAAP